MEESWREIVDLGNREFTGELGALLGSYNLGPRHLPLDELWVHSRGVLHQIPLRAGLRVKMCVWLGVSRGLDLAFLNAD